MLIKEIYEIQSNRDWLNYRVIPIDKTKPRWERRGELMNIKLYEKATNPKEIMKELKKWFKYWYDSRIWQRKHHKGITTSFFYEG